jgi:hypothetical protein
VIFDSLPVAPWGTSLRLGMAYGRPNVDFETPWFDVILRLAVYLIATGKDRRATARALGGALVAVAVEDCLASDLPEKVRQRTVNWEDDVFPEALDAAYGKMIWG